MMPHAHGARGSRAQPENGNGTQSADVLHAIAETRGLVQGTVADGDHAPRAGEQRRVGWHVGMGRVGASARAWRPIKSDQQGHEQLGEPTALAVLSSDVIPSCVRQGVDPSHPRAGGRGGGARARDPGHPLAAGGAGLLLVVLAIVRFCYRQVAAAYPVNGGSYVVSRENFGYAAAQIPAAALFCSYTLTVAVLVPAGVDALISAFPMLSPYPVEVSTAFCCSLRRRQCCWRCCVVAIRAPTRCTSRQELAALTLR